MSRNFLKIPTFVRFLKGTSKNSQNCEFGVTKTLLNQHFKF